MVLPVKSLCVLSCSTFSTSTTSAVFSSCPNMPKVKSALTTIFPAFLVRENWPVTGVVKRSRLWHNKIESLLQKVELGSTWRNMLPQLATSKFVAWQVESEGVIRATRLFNLQCNNVARQVERKCCPYYLTLRVFKKLRGKCSIWKYICRRLEFLVFSDKDDKP